MMWQACVSLLWNDHHQNFMQGGGLLSNGGNRHEAASFKFSYSQDNGATWNVLLPSSATGLTFSSGTVLSCPRVPVAYPFVNSHLTADPVSQATEQTDNVKVRSHLFRHGDSNYSDGFLEVLQSSPGGVYNLTVASISATHVTHLSPTSTPPPMVTTLSRALTTLPGVPSSLPGVLTSLPGVVTSLPGVVTSLPGVQTSLPGVPTSLPGVLTSLPGVVTSLPGVLTSLPGVQTSDRKSVV